MDRKIGEGHVAAMARLGLKELRNALNPSRESVADTEVGLYGNLTQGEIAQGRDGPGQGAEQEATADKLSLNELRSEAQQKRQEAERDTERDKGQDHDRGMER